jgi:hypothetical protein
MRAILPLSLVPVLFCGCGGTGGPGEPTAAQVPEYELVPVDSIGVEMGDSNYVMGAIEGIAYGPDGNIVVLDCIHSCVRIYSPGGEFIRQISNKGNGPGELQDVAFLGISEDGHMYIAGEGGSVLGLHVFDYATGEWLGSESVNGSPPTCIEGADGSAHVRMDLQFDMSSGEPLVTTSVDRWEYGAEEPEVVYCTGVVEWDPADFGHMVTVLWDGYDIAAGFDGRVYIAPLDTQDAMVYAFEKDGTELYTVDLGLEPVLRTEEELEMERMILRSRAAVMGDQEMPMEPDPYRPLISALELDGEGNLWVHRGDLARPTFMVLDGDDGTLLYTAAVHGDPPDGSTWRFYMDGHGTLAYAADPAEGYQKVYVLEKREL